MVIDVNNAPGVFKDSEIVQNQSETTPRSWLEETTSEPDSARESDRIQDRSTYHPDVITDKECHAHRRSDLKAKQTTPIAIEEVSLLPQVIEVDKELQPHAVQRELSIEDNILVA